jgi:hypothetical protein
MSEIETPKRARKAIGPERPVYFDQSDIDRVMAVVLALASEVASLRERLDTHERLAAGGALDLARVEAYAPDTATSTAREAWREAYIKRLFRVFTEDLEALRRSPAAPE